MTTATVKDQIKEVTKCLMSCSYFINQYVQIMEQSSEEGDYGGRWIPFTLWPEQEDALEQILENQRCIILKARQLGFTWLLLAVILWLMIFRPGSECLIFSRREKEANYLLKDRLRKMYDQLPEILTYQLEIAVDSSTVFSLSNQSTARAFPTSAGDSYTASLAMVDEADLVDDLSTLMNGVKPTIDNGGKMILLSRSNKKKPESLFKKIYRAAKAGKNQWAPVFVPWYAHPERDLAWYQQIRKDTLANTGYLDDIHEQYPATDVEALAAKTADKRFPPEWLKQSYRELHVILNHDGPAINGLEVFSLPVPDQLYLVGVDTAEGNPTSDDSSIEVRDLVSGREVCALAGKFEPSTTAYYADLIAYWYARAPIIVERNNHGSAVLLWLQEHGRTALVRGPDGKYGWNTNAVSKAQMWSRMADAMRDGLITVHSFETFNQLANIDGSTLKAPDGTHDDRAVAISLTVVGEDHLPSGWDSVEELGTVEDFESPWA